MKLSDLVIKEYFAIVERLQGNYEIVNNQIILNNDVFYSFLDKNLYVKRVEKLKIYRSLNMIVCNSNSYTSVIYDKEKKKTARKIIINFGTYKILKILYTTEIQT